MGDKEENSRVEHVQTELIHILDHLPHEIPIFLFTDKEKNQQFSAGARDVIKMLTGITSKIKFKEYPLSHKMAGKWNIDRSPTMLFAPEQFNIRWLGAPLGEEGKIFVEILVMVGHRKSYLSDQSQKILKKINSPRSIKLFVSLTCPYCPQQAVNVLKAAVAKPEMISLEIIDIQANPDLADRYSAFSTPMTFANGVMIAKGAQPEELFMASLEKMEENQSTAQAVSGIMLDMGAVDKRQAELETYKIAVQLLKIRDKQRSETARVHKDGIARRDIAEAMGF